jgi:hypothetical protein
LDMTVKGAYNAAGQALGKLAATPGGGGSAPAYQIDSIPGTATPVVP